MTIDNKFGAKVLLTIALTCFPGCRTVQNYIPADSNLIHTNRFVDNYQDLDCKHSETVTKIYSDTSLGDVVRVKCVNGQSSILSRFDAATGQKRFEYDPTSFPGIKVTTWYPNGNLHDETNANLEGKMDGRKCAWNKDGSLRKEEVCLEGACKPYAGACKE